jgi:hypothetical protein
MATRKVHDEERVRAEKKLEDLQQRLDKLQKTSSDDRAAYETERVQINADLRDVNIRFFPVFLRFLKPVKSLRTGYGFITGFCYV